jgi:hypothetical protein
MPVMHPEARVRAGLMRFLATEQDPAHRVHERGFGLSGMRVVERLDLASCEVRRPLRFIDCVLDDVDITGAKLATLTFQGGRLGALDGDRCVATALFLRGVGVFRGARLLGAQLAGDLDCTQAWLHAARPASVGLEQSTAENAALSLDGATISGALFLRGTRVQGSLIANGLSVAKLFDATGMFVCSGQVALALAVIGGDMQMRGSAIRTSPPFAASPYEHALVLAQARIAGSLRLSELFQADGPIDLSDARIAGNLSIRAALFMGDADFAVRAQRMQVEGTFDLDSRTCFGAEPSERAIKKLPELVGPLGAGKAARQPLPPFVRGAALDLTAATVGSLSDQWAHWPRGSRVLGFRYKEIVGATSTRAAWWVRWLHLQPDEDLSEVESAAPVVGRRGFKPQPWDQTMLALRGAGCLRDAEDVAIAKETAEFAFSKNPFHFLHVLWGICAGYGYRPLRLLWALPVVYLFSVWVYTQAADRGVMAPTREEFLANAEYQHCHPEHGGNWARCALAPAYPDFNAWAYAVQTLLPAIEVRQSKDWAPVAWQRPIVPIPPAKAASGAASGASATVALVEKEPVPASTNWGRNTLYWSWIEATLGLAAPVLVGLALSGLIRRKLKD